MKYTRLLRILSHLLLRNMIEFSVKGVKVSVHFSFFAAAALLMLCKESDYAVYGLYACLLHETGHLIAMYVSGQPINKLIFYGAGIKIVQPSMFIKQGLRYELIILSAGCAVNFIMYAISLLFNNEVFAAVNLLIGIFNLLPLNFLDGGKIILLFLYSFLNTEKGLKAEKYLKAADMIIIPLVLIFFKAFDLGNFTLYVTLIYLLFTAIIL